MFSISKFFGIIRCNNNLKGTGYYDCKTEEELQALKEIGYICARLEILCKKLLNQVLQLKN